MEIFTAVLGFAMIYAWAHSVVIIAKKIQDVSTYETVVMVVGAIGVVLYIIGTV